MLVSFLLDRSGSMSTYKSDTLASFNRFLKDQKKVPGECRFHLTQFDTESIDTVKYETLKAVPKLTDENYSPRAGTPLYDAICLTVERAAQKAKKGEKVIFVIQTDGEENSSRRWNQSDAMRVLAEKKNKLGWDIIFLAADINAERVIPRQYTTGTFAYASGQSSAAFGQMTNSVTTARTGAPTMVTVSPGTGAADPYDSWAGTDDDD